MKTSRLLVALLVGCGEAPYPDYWDADAVGPTVCAVSREVLTSTTGGKELVIGGTGLGGTTTVGERTTAHYSARMREIVGTEDPEVIWELIVGSPGEHEETGWFVYRAQRIDGLYPLAARPE